MIYRIGKICILITVAFGLAGCPAERFRHEKYSCNSTSFDLESIVVNEAKVGSEIQIIGYGNERTAIITTINDDMIAVEDSRLQLELNRNDGSVKIIRGTRFARLACKRSIFTM
jgi:hypothetical protein